ncbi:hypothetical protein FHT77_000974 [Rhizobium sp. BK181]|uniref:hypothetical protein n=1 Tax=Rhizobium sp. BK181 TaxID=2587072 RepID=UPI00161BFC86|nr:hypothetical protein [Rhizobium sp. BK181]MBB3315132.1 hypothetical protein [Rhizobium sp. BK181]
MTGNSLRVLIGCETSGRMRRAFAELGHDVWSCDLLPSVDGSNRHIIGDVRDLLAEGWDLLAVMHPPCTRLCNSGVRWLTKPPTGKTLEQMWSDLDDGAALFSDCWNAPIERIAIENPVMHRHAKERIRNYQPPAQTVQPWWFGDKALKATSFYLKGLPKLVPTNKLTPPAVGTDERNRWARVHRAPPSVDRWKLRSETYPGIAAAAAAQWGGYALQEAAAA